LVNSFEKRSTSFLLNLHSGTGGAQAFFRLLRVVSITILLGMVFFVSFPLGGGWRKIPCLFAAGYPDLPWATLRCNTSGLEKKDVFLIAGLEANKVIDSLAELL
jgi:hypothetical protein